MGDIKEFPFKVGQFLETKSNVKGYRGAWFRSQESSLYFGCNWRRSSPEGRFGLKGIKEQKGEFWCELKFLDFPDEKMEHTKLYQQDPLDKMRQILMIRPAFPPIYQNDDAVSHLEEEETLVIINNDWQAGDIVDWWSDDCFWMGIITSIISKDLLEIELPSAPVGEGGLYTASAKDLRPSLDWSIEHQHWTTPLTKDKLNNSTSFILLASRKNSYQELRPRSVDSTLIVHKNISFDRSKLKLFENQAALRRKRKALLEGEEYKHEKSGGKEVGSNGKDVLEMEGLILNGFNGFEGNAVNDEEAMDGREGKRAHQQELEIIELSSSTSSENSSLDFVLGMPWSLDEKNMSLELFEGSKHIRFDWVDVEDENVGSSIIAFEEQVSRALWLKGVARYGLKKFQCERHKIKWDFC